MLCWSQCCGNRQMTIPGDMADVLKNSQTPGAKTEGRSHFSLFPVHLEKGKAKVESEMVESIPPRIRKNGLSTSKSKKKYSPEVVVPTPSLSKNSNASDLESSTLKGATPSGTPTSAASTAIAASRSSQELAPLPSPVLSTLVTSDQQSTRKSSPRTMRMATKSDKQVQKFQLPDKEKRELLAKIGELVADGELDPSMQPRLYDKVAKGDPQLLMAWTVFCCHGRHVPFVQTLRTI